MIGTWRGLPVGETTVRDALTAATKEAGLKGEDRLSPHSLRHGYASRLGLGGLNATTLARILGHTDASFTLRTYAPTRGRSKMLLPTYSERRRCRSERPL